LHFISIQLYAQEKNGAFAPFANNIVAFALFNTPIFMHFDYGIFGT
jgi:hypothetical protein